ncbi:maleylacetoacetate isomerase [Arenibaculum pallidiluteum]|uniref:maleylacetoacetate isomerase n=1 Tax=Arenibaculum pallidiluteum TaxID=2812559 RepID=UPI001A96133C|nr:maleylacetoacetate isomerase [Arenibaculum pallidiluteum]
MMLYDYFRSSAAYRVRIALNLKGLAAERRFVHLRKGEQRAPAFTAVNPQGLVPALLDDAALTQSLAIVEYLDETHPEPPLLPGTAADRARIRALALAVACDIHPLNNLRVLKYLVGPLGVPDEKKNEWYRHWVRTGFEAIETMLVGDGRTGRFCHGDAPSLADVVLVPQAYNAERFDMDLAAFPTIRRIVETCRALPAFADAAPERQADAE